MYIERVRNTYSLLKPEINFETIKIKEDPVIINGKKFLTGQDAILAAQKIAKANNKTLNVNEVVAVWGHIIILYPDFISLYGEESLIFETKTIKKHNNAQIVAWIKKSLKNIAKTDVGGNYILKELQNNNKYLTISMYDIKNKINIKCDTKFDGIDNIEWIYNLGSVKNYCTYGKTNTSLSAQDCLFHEIVHAACRNVKEDSFLINYFKLKKPNFDFNHNGVDDKLEPIKALVYHFTGDMGEEDLPQEDTLSFTFPKNEALATYFEKIFQKENGKKIFYRDFYIHKHEDQIKKMKTFSPSSQLGEIQK